MTLPLLYRERGIRGFDGKTAKRSKNPLIPRIEKRYCMKKSILIFLFISSTLSAFYYALSRTEGNVYKSIIFTIYFLSIKLNLIEPNLPIILDQCQSDQEIVRVLPYYTSNYSDSYSGRSRIYMAKIEQPNYVSYHSQSVIDELRAGGRLKDAAFFLAMLHMLK